ncbi:MAG: hypothetical protein ABIG11_10130 [bacterium]
MEWNSEWFKQKKRKELIKKGGKKEDMEEENKKGSGSEERGCGMKITDRDIQILSALELWGVLDEAQLTAAFKTENLDDKTRIEMLFGNRKELITSAMRQRMLALRKAGYVRIHRFIMHPQMYGLTKDGHALLRNMRRNKLPDCQHEVAPLTVEHNRIAASVGLVFSHIDMMPVISMRQVIHRRNRKIAQGHISRRNSIIPDLLVGDPAWRKLIEIEINLKSSARYRRIWRIYQNTLENEEAVLYVVPDRTAEKRLYELARELQVSCVYFMDIPTFRASQGLAYFTGPYGKTYLPDCRKRQEDDEFNYWKEQSADDKGQGKLPALAVSNY